MKSAYSIIRPRAYAQFFFVCAFIFMICAALPSTASASTHEEIEATASAALEVYGPTIANVPWEYVPAWYKVELVRKTVYGPTIANVPWEFVPEWYKAELAAKGVVQGTSTTASQTSYGPSVQAPQELVPAWYTESPASGGAVVPTQSGTISTQAESEAQVGKESASSFGSAVDLAAIEASEWGEGDGKGDAGMTEARASFMSETGFFFLGVFLIFIALVIAGVLRRRKEEVTPGS